jgi:hypothetical protein
MKNCFRNLADLDYFGLLGFEKKKLQGQEYLYVRIMNAKLKNLETHKSSMVSHPICTFGC